MIKKLKEWIFPKIVFFPFEVNDKAVYIPERVDLGMINLRTCIVIRGDENHYKDLAIHKLKQDLLKEISKYIYVEERFFASNKKEYIAYISINKEKEI